MKNREKNTRIDLPNFVLIAGNGRNVGKTWFSCRLIKHLCHTTKVSAIKVSAHFHPFNEDDVLIQENNFVIIEEKNVNGKDSSLMLQAGARKVYFIMAQQEHLQEAFLKLKPLLPSHAIVCESGGLHEVLEPGLFFFINSKGKAILKTQHLVYEPITVLNDGKNIDFDLGRVRFLKNRFNLYE